MWFDNSTKLSTFRTVVEKILTSRCCTSLSASCKQHRGDVHTLAQAKQFGVWDQTGPPKFHDLTVKELHETLL